MHACTVCFPDIRSAAWPCKKLIQAVGAVPCRYEQGKKEGKYNEEEAKRERAKQSLERYMHYYQRFAEHDKARKQVHFASAPDSGHGPGLARVAVPASWLLCSAA